MQGKKSKRNFDMTIRRDGEEERRPKGTTTVVIVFHSDVLGRLGRSADEEKISIVRVSARLLLFIEVVYTRAREDITERKKLLVAFFFWGQCHGPSECDRWHCSAIHVYLTCQLLTVSAVCW